MTCKHMWPLAAALTALTFLSLCCADSQSTPSSCPTTAVDLDEPLNLAFYGSRLMLEKTPSEKDAVDYLMGQVEKCMEMECKEADFKQYMAGAVASIRSMTPEDIGSMTDDDIAAEFGLDLFAFCYLICQCSLLPNGLPNVGGGALENLVWNLSGFRVHACKELPQAVLWW